MNGLFMKESGALHVKIHVVNRGDSLWRISQQYGVSTNRIVRINGLENPYKLVIGLALLIPEPYSSVQGTTRGYSRKNRESVWNNRTGNHANESHNKSFYDLSRAKTYHLGHLLYSKGT
ncbi:LysM domain-containing protein (plasmid) [Peribacillus sp. R9-11]|nr:LysM domain-containing protein [Peribacillus sp. R9-11]WMX58793.1 LysM domain-containing protein [Peribacillus sp. R9-11]